MIKEIGGKFFFFATILTIFGEQAAWAQFPNWKAIPVRPRGELIPPLGNHLPLSYRAQMNRPTYLGGRIAYTIEPSSQEAMAWQKAWEKGYYANHAPRMETHYIYPQAWEVLGVEPKPKREFQGDPGESAPIRYGKGQTLEHHPGGIGHPGRLLPETVDVPPGEIEASEAPSKLPTDPPESPLGSSSQELRTRLRSEHQGEVDRTGALRLAPAIELYPVVTDP